MANKIKQIKFTKGVLRSEYKVLDRYDPTADKMIIKGGESILYFQWTQLNNDSYLIIIPKLFKKNTGDSYAIINSKKFLKLLNDK